MVGRTVAALSGLYANQVLLNRAWELYNRCKGHDSDLRIPVGELEKFRELITFYEKQLQKMKDEANIHETAFKNPLEYFAKSIVTRKSVAVSKVFVDVGKTSGFRDMPTYGGSTQPITHP